ncbi:hypothetical protein Dsin_011553 [Dipteronia sinensis]|uniref:Reverse transcriptase domain-containing protein n=1 Tax=Dipteronia sinensis TaxID=43782 RepID=A0AAE0EDM4_9ROSI|nr:hypothetical protein Dsin_011553 [Dipteronia sinensis]
MNEKGGGSNKSISEMLAFRKAVEDYDLIDLGFSGPIFTWNNKREGRKNIQERGKGFKFEPFRLQEVDIERVVEQAWDEKGKSHLTKELKSKQSWCAAKLSAWSAEPFGSLHNRIGNIQREIEELYMRCSYDGVMISIRTLGKKLKGLLIREEVYLKQRSMDDWLSAGDRNSKYFNVKATTRKRKNSISKLLDDNGQFHDSDTRLSQVIHNYFSTLFKSSVPSPGDIANASVGIGSSLSSVMIGELSRPYSAEEIKRAIFDMGPTKAHGPDGFHAIFFQKFWKMVGTEVTNVCLRVLSSEMAVTDFNQTNMTMILKVQNLISLKDFRSISLCSVVYKMMMKTLANRLNACLPAIISPNQSAFVPGR